MKKFYWTLIGIFTFSLLAIGQGQPLSIEDCITMARQTHPAIKAVQMAKNSATYQKRMAIATALPSLGAKYSYTWMDPQPTISINIPGLAKMDMPASGKEVEQLNVTATQPLFTGGAVINAWKLAKLNEQDAGFQIQQVDSEVVFQTRTTFYGVLKAKEYVDLTRQAVEMAESLRKRAKDYFDVGFIAKSQVLQAEVNLADMKQQQTSAQSGLAMAKTALNILIGRESMDEIDVKGKLEKVPFTTSMEECVKTGLKQRPEMLSAQTRAEMADHLVAIDRAGWFPQIAAIAGFQHQEGSFTTTPYNWSFTLAGTWTFWEWGKKYYKVKSTQEMAGQAKQAIHLTEDRITLEVKQAYLKLREAEQNIDTSKSAITSADENLRVMKAKFEQQMATSFDVLTAQTMLVRAQTNEVSALTDYMTARAALDRAMGVAVAEPTQNPASGTTTINPNANPNVQPNSQPPLPGNTPPGQAAVPARRAGD